jgi:hypothetical protein
MSAFAALGIKLHFISALALIPVAAIGHIAGLKAHDAIMQNDQVFRRWVGGGLMLVSLLGFWKLYF